MTLNKFAPPLARPAGYGLITHMAARPEADWAHCSLVPGADTADQGMKVYPHIKAALDASHHIIVSFDGVQTATSSFVRTAFVELLKARSFSDLKAQMGIIDSTRRSTK
jgi:hypothetical protein